MKNIRKRGAERNKMAILNRLFSSRSSPVRLKTAMVSMGLIIVILIIGVFVGYRRVSDEKRKETTVSSPPVKASVSLNRIHQTAARDGVKEWSLDAESAQYFKEKNQVVFKNPEVVFFRKNRSDITLSAKEGTLDTASNNFFATGAVTVTMGEYTLETEKISYNNKKKMIRSMARSKIVKGDLFMEADAISFDLQADSTTFQGNVKGRMHETFIF
jgi:LPS export ABC transporter protein LptC